MSHEPRVGDAELRKETYRVHFGCNVVRKNEYPSTHRRKEKEVWGVRYEARSCGRSSPDTLIFVLAKRPDDRADYCLDCSLPYSFVTTSSNVLVRQYWDKIAKVRTSNRLSICPVRGIAKSPNNYRLCEVAQKSSHRQFRVSVRKTQSRKKQEVNDNGGQVLTALIMIRLSRVPKPTNGRAENTATGKNKKL